MAPDDVIIPDLDPYTGREGACVRLYSDLSDLAAAARELARGWSALYRDESPSDALVRLGEAVERIRHHPKHPAVEAINQEVVWLLRAITREKKGNDGAGGQHIRQEE